MPEFTGSGLYVKYGSTVLSTDFKSFDENQETNLIDASAGADTGRSYLATLDDGNATMDMLAQAGGTPLWAAVAARTSGTLEWGPEGTASGNEKNTVVAIVKSRKRTIVHDDVVKITVDFQFNGDITHSVY